MATDAQGLSRRLTQVGCQGVQQHTGDRSRPARKWNSGEPESVGKAHAAVHGLYDHDRGLRHSRHSRLGGRERATDQ
jgi:hypothetical protein